MYKHLFILMLGRRWLLALKTMSAMVVCRERGGATINSQGGNRR